MLRRFMLIAAAAWLMAPPAVAAQSSQDTASQNADAHGGSGASGEEPYIALLQPGDIVRLRIWREPDLSGEYPVDETGTVVFPLIGPQRVTEESPASLKERLVAEYQVYLRHPSIDVILLRRVNVLGSVARPGLYPVDLTMTLADAIALAGGATPIGDSEKIQLIRDGETVTTRLSQRTRLSQLAIRSGDQLVVPERNWISRNSNIVAAAITGTISLIVALVISAN